MQVQIVRWSGNTAREETDSVVVEEPLEIRIGEESLTVTMRTPGDDFDLIAGFLFAEGLIRSAADIRFMGYGVNPNDPDRQNVVQVALSEEAARLLDTSRRRNFAATASCGVCGKANLEAVRCVLPPRIESDFRVSVGVIRSLNEKMRAAQRVFATTGGLHAAGLFDGAGSLLALREDVGRHNAVDKLIGAEVLARRVPLSDHLLMVSGRVSFEIVQKVAMAGVPVLCAVSAPSSLAVQLSQEWNMTLIGFLRGDTMNVYTGAERVRL